MGVLDGCEAAEVFWRLHVFDVVEEALDLLPSGVLDWVELLLLKGLFILLLPLKVGSVLVELGLLVSVHFSHKILLAIDLLVWLNVVLDGLRLAL